MIFEETARLTQAVERTRKGETDAYNIIVAHCMQKLYAAALAICKNRATAEDLVQETFLDGYLRLGSLREAEKVESWLMRILRNKTLNIVMRSRISESEEVLARVADTRSPESTYLAAETRAEWRQKFASLSPALRQTALLYFYEELPMEEIARRQAVPLGTVKRRIHDARVKLRKEHDMENTTAGLPDSFVEKLAEKIKDLERYTQTFGTQGFDEAYRSVQALIAEVRSEERAKAFAVETAKIASNADIEKYAEEALATYRTHGEVMKATWLYLELAWKLGNDREKIAYTKETILPALASYPDSELKIHALALHYFWMAYYADKSTEDGRNEARSYLYQAMAYYTKNNTADASHANTIAALKALDCLSDGRALRDLDVTGETWLEKDGNFYYLNEPGCGYGYSSLYIYCNPLFYYSGYSGDRWFLPRTIPLIAGAEEPMVDQNGHDSGMRKVIATDETVTTPAGTFANCLHLRKTENDGTNCDAWYKKDIGLVKAICEGAGDAGATKVLSAYEIVGGDGWMPIAVGNRWCYVTPNAPDALYERNEYVIERVGRYFEPHITDKAIAVSCLNYTALNADWAEASPDPALQFVLIDEDCEARKFAEARKKLEAIVLANTSRESVDMALAMLPHIEETVRYSDAAWRICPSSTNISRLTLKDGKLRYQECAKLSFDTGPFGTRHVENRIFGVKPLRYLQTLCGTLWDDRWMPGFTATEHTHEWRDDAVTVTVRDGGTVETPAGTFEDTICVTATLEIAGNRDRAEHYFYQNTDCGVKEFWFAPGVGIVHHRCTWGSTLSSDALLTDYRVIARDDEMMPVAIGNRWRYEEVGLSAENYIARREYAVISGRSGEYLLGDNQMFTWKGTAEEYEAFKKTLQ